MEERQKHIDTFNIYYGLGTKRSLAKLHRHLTKTVPNSKDVPALRTLKVWSHEFDWQARIVLQDREINNKAQKKIMDGEVNVRVTAHQSVMRTRDLFLACAGTAFYTDKKTGKDLISPDVAIKSAHELNGILLGIIKCEEAGVHLIAPEPPQEPSTVTITIKSARDLPDKN